MRRHFRIRMGNKDVMFLIVSVAVGIIVVNGIAYVQKGEKRESSPSGILGGLPIPFALTEEKIDELKEQYRDRYDQLSDEEKAEVKKRAKARGIE